MTKFSKILAIFVAVASLAFVGFAIAATFGGPDWMAVTQESYFGGYTISRSEGADAAWSATRASDKGQVATSKVLPEVLTAVMDEVLQQQKQEVQQLEASVPNLEARIAALEARESLDEQALQAYIADLRQRIATLTQQEAELTSKVTAAAVESRKIERQVAARREDVIRLGQQVEELRADIYRLNEIRSQLRDLDIQYSELVERARQRQRLLKEYSPQPQ